MTGKRPLVKDAEKYKNQVVVLEPTNELWYSRPAKQGYEWHPMTKYSRHPIVLNWLKGNSKPKLYRFI